MEAVEATEKMNNRRTDFNYNYNNQVKHFSSQSQRYSHNHSQSHSFPLYAFLTEEGDEVVGAGNSTDNDNDNSTDSNSTNHTVAPTTTVAPTNSSNHTVVPTPAPSNHSHTDNSTNTSAPTTLAPTTLAPTPSHTKKYTTKPTMAPTVEPSNHHHKSSSAATMSAFKAFFRAIGRMIAWSIVLGLGILFYGWCINHRYHIAYYCRHFGHCLMSCYRVLAVKFRQRFGHSAHNHNSNYYDAVGQYESPSTNMNTIIFDPPSSTSPSGGNNMHNNTNNNSSAATTNYSTDQGFVLGQHSTNGNPFTN